MTRRNFEKAEFIWTYGSRAIRGSWWKAWQQPGTEAGSEAENSQGEHEAEGAYWKWGEPVNSDSLPPVTYFLSQGHIS